ncbi:MAG TPA: CCA tRNA nucleotidyltransferase [Alphaproteobacteria bacterium]|nr:CCA tRNA nucleotidyltransferase [Alphaproteobacteria bacterium]
MNHIQANFLQENGANPLLEGARGIIMALTAAGEECRFVGGCVRDALAGLPLKDIDLATTALPEKVMAVLSITGFQVIPVGLTHGVVIAMRDGKKYEIATLREDVKTDGRHAVVAFTRDWELDAQRRDFTINAMSMDLDGKLYDTVGGADDLAARRVRFIGDADSRIKEDYLRILRFYRFDTMFGSGDAATRAACRNSRSGIQNLSRERMTEELTKLLSLLDPLAACRAMVEDGVAAEITLQLTDIPTLQRLLAREAKYDLLMPWFVRLAAWGGLAYQFDETLADVFVFTRTVRAELKFIATIDLNDLQAALYHHGVARVLHAVMLCADEEGLPKFIQEINAFVPREFPIQAEDILAMGVAPGPRLGEILRETENWWLAGNFIADAAACKDYATTLATVSKT